MRSDYWVRAEEGLLGRELTQQEIEDDQMEAELEASGFFLDDETREAMQTALVSCVFNGGGI